MSDLGPTQRHVLLNLSFGSSTIDRIAYPNYSDAAISGAVRRLYDQELVEPVRWNGRRREWEITQNGLEALDSHD